MGDPPHLARIPEGPETVRQALGRLDAHALLDRCAEVSETLARTERDAVERGVALSGGAACRKARREARRLTGASEAGERVTRKTSFAPGPLGRRGFMDPETDVLAYMTFPNERRTKLHSTNPIERLNGEIKRRTDVVGIFPNDDAIVRLVGALLLEQNDERAVQRAQIHDTGNHQPDERRSPGQPASRGALIKSALPERAATSRQLHYSQGHDQM